MTEPGNSMPAAGPTGSSWRAAGPTGSGWRAAGRSAHRIPAPALFLVSGFTQYYGAALAVNLFAVISAVGLAWWRIAVSAVVLVAWQRPWRTRWNRRTLTAAAGFGVVLGTMNVSFYLALAHLPLGTAVAIEFLGPVGVAAIGGRGWRERAGIAVAGLGVVALAGVSLRGGWTTGVIIGLAAVLAAAACWAGYILLGHKVATQQHGLPALALGMTAGTLVYVPLGALAVEPVVTDWRRLLVVIGIGVLSSVIPYAIEQVVLRRVSAAQFAILLALLPVAATVMGLLVLHQVPDPVELGGVAAICVAIVMSTWGHRDTGESVS